eukprot:1023430_1
MALATRDDSWCCKVCTYRNNSYMENCEMCATSKTKQWQCPTCTVVNTEDNSSCISCNTRNPIQDANQSRAHPPLHTTHSWKCSNCTFLNTKDINQCEMCSNIKSMWQCSHCFTSNPQSRKICVQCHECNVNKYWKCPKCTYINDKTDQKSNVCSMCSDPSIQPTSSPPHSNNMRERPLALSQMGVFVDFRDKTEEKTIVVTLRKDNQLQREHFDHFEEILHELYTSALFINTAFMEKHLDSNNTHLVTTFIDIVQELASFLTKNNKTIIQQIKMAIECQSDEPEQITAQCKPVWDNLNEFVCGLFEVASDFLEVRDEFVLVLMDIMWRPDRLQMKESVIEKLKQNIKDGEAMLEDDSSYSDTKMFKALHQITVVLPGHAAVKTLCDNIPRKADEHKQCLNALNSKVEEYNATIEQRKQSVKTKKAQLANKKRLLDAEKQRFEQAKTNQNYDLAKTYAESCTNLVDAHNKIVTEIDIDIDNTNNFSKRFETMVQPMKEELNKKKEEFEKLMQTLKEIRSLTGIKGDNIIQEFVQKVHDLGPLSMEICGTIIKFKVMTSTMSELLVRSFGDDDKENDNISPKIERYFVQNEIKLDVFVEPLHEKNIFDLDDFKKAYQGKLDAFNDELIPYLKDKIGRRVKMREMRKLRRLCEAKH